MSTTQSILEFWKSHPEYWISLGAKQAETDAHITSLYFKQNIKDLPFLDAVIYCDQFMRHFSRVPGTGVDERMVESARLNAVALVQAHFDALGDLAADELMFALMPFKHVEMWETLFSALHTWLPCGAAFTDYPVLNRFYNDSYKKAYGNGPYKLRLTTYNGYNGVWDESICEACPRRETWGKGDPSAATPLIIALRDVAVDGHIWVSLSGGVDSNLLCALGRSAGLHVSAVHIVYGNRSEAEQELAFLADYCDAIGVRLYVYRVPWIRRATADRAFYETITRQLRFGAYASAGAKGGICLGHIQEDVVENVWTNFAHGSHLDNLTKMSAVEIAEGGVKVLRPWLNVRKADIYASAESLNIPHLKNTTPAWSNRGKFRTTFYSATHTQYGTSVDKKVLEVAETLRTQALMLDRLLYKPVFDSYIEGRVDVSPIFKAGGLDADGWLRVLTHFFHAQGVSKPSIHACLNLSKRLMRPFTAFKIPIKSGVELIFTRNNDAYCMEINLN